MAGQVTNFFPSSAWKHYTFERADRDKELFVLCPTLQLSNRKAVNELFSNITWATGEGNNYLDEEILHHWKGPHKNLYLTLALFIVMRVRMSFTGYLRFVCVSDLHSNNFKHLSRESFFFFFFFFLQFWMTAVAITLPVPAGVFMPVFTIGR